MTALSHGFITQASRCEPGGVCGHRSSVAPAFWPDGGVRGAKIHTGTLIVTGIRRLLGDQAEQGHGPEQDREGHPCPTTTALACSCRASAAGSGSGRPRGSRHLTPPRSLPRRLLRPAGTLLPRTSSYADRGYAGKEEASREAEAEGIRPEGSSTPGPRRASCCCLERWAGALLCVGRALPHARQCPRAFARDGGGAALRGLSPPLPPPRLIPVPRSSQ